MPLPESPSGEIARAVKDEVLERARRHDTDRNTARAYAIMAELETAQARRDADAAASDAARNAAREKTKEH